MKHAEDSHALRPVNVTLYDSNQIRVSAEIICACIPDTSTDAGDFNIMIGISEVNERQVESVDALPQSNMVNLREVAGDASSGSGSSVSEDLDFASGHLFNFELNDSYSNNKCVRVQVCCALVCVCRPSWCPSWR